MGGDLSYAIVARTGSAIKLAVRSGERVTNITISLAFEDVLDASGEPERDEEGLRVSRAIEPSNEELAVFAVQAARKAGWIQ